MRLDDIATAMGLSMKAALGPVQTRQELTTETLLSMRHELVALRERLATLEAREPVPGPPGAEGAPGKDGAPGPPGTPGLRYLGVYQPGTPYDVGDLVTHAGSTWHCNGNQGGTQAGVLGLTPGDGSQFWTLMVKRGRDGKGAH